MELARLPFQRQPRPRAAATISSSAGKYATPTTGSLFISNAIRTP